MDDVLYLLKISYTFDEYRNQVETFERQVVFCKVNDITRTEFFASGREGLHPSYMFEVFYSDYDNEKILEYNGKRYGVYRTYRVGDYIEIYAEETVGVTEA